MVKFSDGSWGSPEEAAYVVLTLVTISSLPHLKLLEMEITPAIKTGRQFLSQSQDHWVEAHSTWIGKITFEVPVSVISQAYCLAAIKAPSQPNLSTSRSTSLATPPSNAVEKISQFLSRLPMFAQVPYWKVKASTLETYSMHSTLKRAREGIFPRRVDTEFGYIDFIPCLWIVFNSCAVQSTQTCFRR